MSTRMVTVTLPIADALEVTRDYYGGIPMSQDQRAAIERCMVTIDDAIETETGAHPADGDPLTSRATKEPRS